MRTKLASLIAGWFGCGYAPVAPGTAGSAAAALIAVLLAGFHHWPPWWFGILALLMLLPAVWASGATAARLKTKDPKFVVVDEVVGQWVAIAGTGVLNWTTCLAAFVLFRVFDIWKPPPVRQLESLPGGYGIVLDDVMAGAYAALVLFLAGCFNLY
jgi:phosphatidylglycerophosphatase A